MANITPAQDPRLQGGLLAGVVNFLRAIFPGVKIQRRNRSLRLSESLSLGDKRIIAVVEYEDKRFLLGATAENISLLQTLGPAEGASQGPAQRGDN